MVARIKECGPRYRATWRSGPIHRKTVVTRCDGLCAARLRPGKFDLWWSGDELTGTRCGRIRDDNAGARPEIDETVKTGIDTDHQ